MPLAFVCNLAGTLAASGVILYANSTLANGASIRKLFGNTASEHAVRARLPAASSSLRGGQSPRAGLSLLRIATAAHCRCACARSRAYAQRLCAAPCVQRHSYPASPAHPWPAAGPATQIIKYPAAFLVFGVSSLFIGFCIGIALFYGLGVAIISAVGTLVAYLVYEKFFAQASHTDTFSSLNVGLMALFFRSCFPDVAKLADEHPATAAAAEEAAAIGSGPDPASAAEEGKAGEEAEDEEEARKRALWDERAGAIGRAVAAELRAEPVPVRRDPRDETREFAKKGCCTK
jgi:hypothetical protein